VSARRRWTPRHTPTAALTAPARWAGFAVLALFMAWPGLDAWTTRIPGDPGDAFFNLYVLEWGAESLTRGLRDYWGGTIYLGAHLPMAYSDTHLGVVPVYLALRTLTGSPILAFNLLFVGSWAVSCECTYLLARRITGRVVAPVVAAIGYTYATIRFGQYSHWQLSFGALLPAVLLLVLVVLDGGGRRRSALFGALLGGTWALMTLSASYYGLLALIAMVVIVTTRLVARRGRFDSGTWVGLVTAGLVALALVGPVALQYLDLQRDPAFRREYVGAYAARWEDFLAVRPDNRTLGAAPIVGNATEGRSSENYAFPGIVVTLAGLPGLLLFARRRWWERAGLPGQRWAEAAVLGTVGVVGLLIAMGRNTTVMGWHVLPNLYDPVATVLPGFRGVRALVRLVILPQLVLALAAAATLAVVGDRIRSAVGIRGRQVVATLAVLLALGLVWESRMVITTARPPDASTGGAVNEVLATLPRAGVVELPTVEPVDGTLWAFVECRRMLLSTIDWHPRLTGYSGFAPPGYGGTVTLADTFPSADSLGMLDRLGIRYVVLRTAPVSSGVASVDAMVETSPFSHMSAAEAEQRVQQVPADRLAAVDRVDGAVLVTLTAPSGT
jgi:hypothetical protein